VTRKSRNKNELFCICVRQPVAHYVKTGDRWHLNMTWQCKRNPGYVAIHAALQKTLVEWCAEPSDLVFGAIVAVAHVACILHEDEMEEFIEYNYPAFDWLKSANTTGPFIWILNAIHPLSCSVPYDGWHGCWSLPSTITSLVRSFSPVEPLTRFSSKMEPVS